jgi:hypothetical protein
MNIKDYANNTVLTWAKKIEHTEIVDLLEKAGAEESTKDVGFSTNKTSSDGSTKISKDEAIKSLLGLNSDENRKTKSNKILSNSNQKQKTKQKKANMTNKKKKSKGQLNNSRLKKNERMAVNKELTDLYPELLAEITSEQEIAIFTW